MKLKEDVKEYNLLNTWLVLSSEHENNWMNVREIENEIHTFLGKARIKNDVLILSSWKSHGAISKTIEDWEKYLREFPPWNQTKYFIKIADFGNSGIRFCKDGKKVKEKIAKSILESLR